MKKTIYLYINEKDMEVLNDFFSEYEIGFFDHNKEELINIPAIGEGIKRFYLGINGNISIEYQASYFAINRLQAAFFNTIVQNWIRTNSSMH